MKRRRQASKKKTVAQSSSPKSGEVAAHLADVFRHIGPIDVRRMFGGYGVYRQGIMFGLVAGDTLYLKTDAENAPAFRERDLAPFTYERKGKVMETSYYAAPEAVMEDPAEASHWGRSALEAALRVNARRSKRRK